MLARMLLLCLPRRVTENEPMVAVTLSNAIPRVVAK